MCDRVGVLYAGELVEEGTATEVFHSPRHPYTVGLLRSIPRREEGLQRTDGARHHPRPRCPPPEPRSPAASSPTAAGWRTSAAGPRRRRCMRSAAAAARAATTTSEPRRCRCSRSRPKRGRGAPPVITGVGNGAGVTPGEPVVRIRGASKTFRQGGDSIRGLLDVDLDIAAGETGRPGRRVGQRQDDACPGADGAHGARRRRRGGPSTVIRLRRWRPSAPPPIRRRCRSSFRTPIRR